MSTSQQKADNYIRKMSQADAEIRKELGIEHKDVSLTIRVEIQTQARFNNHEDED